LHTLLLRLTLNEHTAEDLMQELFCRLCHVKDLSQVKNLQAYARQTALHLAYDWLRSRKQKTLSLTETGMDPVSPTVSISIERREQLQQILDAAARLEGLMWDCFVMRYVQQMPYETIAVQLEKSSQQVRGLCSKAVRKIRDALNQESMDSSSKEADHGKVFRTKN
jgi:RNA polymerase sigma factor (sigma-70 family)